MHILPLYSVVINALGHFEIYAMYIDSVIHHMLKKPIADADMSTTTWEVSSIGLRSEKSRVMLPFTSDAETIKREVVAILS